MSESASHTRFERPVLAFVLLALGGFALAYVVVALLRAVYPYDLDFLEDDVLVEAWRFAHGLPVFMPPNADFVPHAYAPLYMLLSAAWFKLGSASYLPMRLLSLAASGAAAASLYAAAFQLCRRRALALVAPGLYFA